MASLPLIIFIGQGELLAVRKNLQFSTACHGECLLLAPNTVQAQWSDVLLHMVTHPAYTDPPLAGPRLPQHSVTDGERQMVGKTHLFLSCLYPEVARVSPAYSP